MLDLIELSKQKMFQVPENLTIFSLLRCYEIITSLCITVHRKLLFTFLLSRAETQCKWFMLRKYNKVILRAVLDGKTNRMKMMTTENLFVENFF